MHSAEPVFVGSTGFRLTVRRNAFKCAIAQVVSKQANGEFSANVALKYLSDIMSDITPLGHPTGSKGERPAGATAASPHNPKRTRKSMLDAWAIPWGTSPSREAHGA